MSKETEGVDIVSMKRPHHEKNQPSNTVYKAILAVIGLIIIVGLSFYGGIQYQKHHTSSTTTASTAGRAGGFGGGGFRNRGTIGQVTAVSSSSITVQSNSGTTTTYTINGSTTISDNGQTTTASDIQTGDTVLIMVSSTGSTTASRIIVNPSFGGGFGGGGSNGPSSTDNSTPSTSL